ncbi:kinase-like domain-containing protein [Podospora appendiculata]|uniref:Kinase-like domain-containing protein n=1 Tax=Podospora appendiculata TaxID=314037 RepID=A0AAE0XI76_9PEZI|nr:kinase-like domain-containing protein [Podospora appendiculata]
MNDMSAASPTPMGAGSHFTSLGRRTSARQALRRPVSRSRLSRSESNPAGNAAMPSSATKEPKYHSQPQPQQYATLNDSSDDEIPVPMKLSALTKALLDDGHSEATHRTAAPRPSSPPGRPASRVMTRRSAVAASTSMVADEREPGRESIRQREIKRPARAGSAQLPSSKPSSPLRSVETSPAPRKRVVRLSNPAPANASFQNSSYQGGLRRSLSSSTQRKRPESKERLDERNSQPPLQQEQPPQQDVVPNVNTPVLPVRTVRIVVGSSGKGRSGGSSGVSSKRSGGNSDQEMPEDPATIGRPQTAAPQSSMRVKRVAKVPGSFLSGPARRGRRRQSEEDEEAQAENEAMGSSQEPEGQQSQYAELGLGEQPASSFYAPSYRDYAAQGSPVSARDSARAAIRKQASNASLAASRQRESPKDHLELVYNIPAPPPEVPSTHDKENEAPSTFKRAKPTADTIIEKELGKPARPLNVDIGSFQPSHASPERKALAPKSQNTPHRAAPQPPPKMSVVETATAAGGASAAAPANKKRQLLLRVNGRTYTRIDCIGRGGSGKVYRVSAESGKMLALKRVSLENADENTVKGFKGEIDLLKRLHGVDRVIQLIDHELNLEKQMLSVLMEVGELDFNTLLKSRQSTPEGARLDPVFIRYHWKEMLECVQAVHGRDVVHSDLKPANFVLVQGRLKLIDFGIANAIQTDMTVNVHRETQIGTPNYMSPESLMDSSQYAFTSAHNGRFCIPPPLQQYHHQKGAPKVMKLGKPSDVWSLGCILYQMVYGLPPFGRIANQMSRCQAIINWGHAIDFPDAAEDGSRVPPSLIRTMRRCLNREQKERPTCEELLAHSDPFLYPQEFDTSVYAAAEQGKVLPVTEELLSRIVHSLVMRCREKMPTENETLASLSSAYWASVKKAVTGGGGGGGGGGAGTSRA